MKFLFVLSFALGIFSTDLRAATFLLGQIVPIVTTNSLKIEMALTSKGDASSVKISGQINHAKTGDLLWEGSLGTVSVKPGKPTIFRRTIKKLKPELWSPTSPALYNLKLTISDGTETTNHLSRIGFRTFESRNGQFLLNGRQIFLRGTAINPPGRTIPDETAETREFAEAYVRFMKSHNVNAIRLFRDSPVWFDVCDELGMMVFQGRYGAPAGSAKSSPPKDFNQSVENYKNLFGAYAVHPSILIYILTNEMPYSGEKGKAFHDFLTRMHRVLKKWNSTPLYIGNAGYGQGLEGDICDVHRYWGWYYNTFLTYYNVRDDRLFGDWKKNQPITFTECVGSYTGPSGEFNILLNRQEAAQLNWTGHSTNQAADALRYQAFIAKQATESFRRLRPLNSRLSGVMPFTILFHHWLGITSFEQMKPKLAMEQLGVSYQPVLLSWELWTPQVYAGATIHPTVHVINDADDGAPLTNAILHYELQTKEGRAVLSSKITLPKIPYYSTWSQRPALQLPADLSPGDYRVIGKVISGEKTISTNDVELFVAGPEWKTKISEHAQRVALYDPIGQTASALQKLGINVEPVSDLEKWTATEKVLVIGEFAWDKNLSAQVEKLKKFVLEGGRILCLQQDFKKFETAWLPEPIALCTTSANDTAYLPKERPFRDHMNINPERPHHPVFDGLGREKLALWSDYTNWDQTKPGFPKVYPVTAGFRLLNAESLGRTAVLADYDRALEGIALCEMFSGKGSVILSAFDLANRVAIDPVADRLLQNLIQYAASTSEHELHPFVEKTIQWGNFASEQGIITGPLHGLIINADWVKPVTDPDATPLTQKEAAWASKPGDEFLPRGRSPLGPFKYSTATSLRIENPTSTIGSGQFWCRIPERRSVMITTVKNPDADPAELSIAINGVAAGETLKVPPGETVKFKTPLPDGTNIGVRYSGTKTLVLLETAFE